MSKKHNFSAGPCILPQDVLKKASEAIINFNNDNLSLIEISHRSQPFVNVMEKARSLVKELLDVPSGYSTLFLQGGASLEFLMAPINLMKKDGGKLYMRSIVCDPSIFNCNILTKIHDTVYKKPYDIVPKDWIDAAFKKDAHPQKIDRFWCSALVGYIYTQLEILKNDTDWSILRPVDFSLSGESVKFNSNCSLENFEKILYKS